MGANKVDIVFVVDASGSMSDCFDQLRDNLRSFIEPLNQANFQIRYGLVAYNTSEITFIGGSSSKLIDELYKDQFEEDNYFTSDAEKFLQVLDSVETSCDENSPLALDIAADLPFACISESRRVIALFTDEKFESGKDWERHAPDFYKVLEKIVARKISLYTFQPQCAAAEAMETLPKTIVNYFDADKHSWNDINFSELLGQMGKSISVSTLQMIQEPTFIKGVYHS